VLNTLAEVASCSADLRFADIIRASLEPQNRVEVLPWILLPSAGYTQWQRQLQQKR